MSEKFIETEKIYIQIAMDLKNSIIKGSFKEGEKLPSEEDLSKKYSVSRGTIRKSIAILVEENLVKKVHGKGTFVNNFNTGYPFAQSLISHAETLKNRGIDFETIIVSKEEINPNNDLKSKLKLQEGRVLYLVRLRLVNNKPAGLFKNWVVLDMVPEIKEYDFSSIGLFEAIEQNGIQKIKFGIREFSAVNPSTEERDLLNLNNGEPVLKLEQTTFNQDNQIIECSDVLLRTDLYKISSVLTR